MRKSVAFGKLSARGSRTPPGTPGVTSASSRLPRSLRYCARPLSAPWPGQAPTRPGPAPGRRRDGVAPLPPAGGALEALVSSAIDAARGRARGQFPSPEDLEREIFWRIERVLVTQNGDASALRAEIAAVLAETDAMRSALLAAIETGNDHLRSDVIAAIDTLSSGLPEMASSWAPVTRVPPNGSATWTGTARSSARSATSSAGRRRTCASPGRTWPPSGSGRPGPGRASRGRPGPTLDRGLSVPGPAALRPGTRRGVLRPSAADRRADRQAGRTAGRPVHGRRIRRVRGGQVFVAARGPAARAGRGPGSSLEGSQHWPRVVMTPTGDPLTELATQLAALGGGDAQAIRHALAADPERAGLTIGQAAASGLARTPGGWSWWWTSSKRSSRSLRAGLTPASRRSSPPCARPPPIHPARAASRPPWWSSRSGATSGSGARRTPGWPA